MSDRITYELRRHRLPDGAETTTYVVALSLGGLRPRVQLFRQPRRLDHWCSKHGVGEAIVGGFYLRDPFRPLGEVWIDGRPVPGEPFPPAFAGLRPALHVGRAGVEIVRRERLPDTPERDLLQAGPLLVEDGRVVFEAGSDREGFSSGAGQFDSDITDGRHPRAAVGLGDEHLFTLTCDGRRSLVDAGLTLTEVAEIMRDLGCRVAMNLDGGGSTTMVHRGHLLNRPYSEQDQPAPASRPIVTALLLDGD